MHVLLIEPDRLEAHTYVTALERAGYTVAHTTGAQSAVHLADERMPDVVVLELQLPGHNGVEFLYEFCSYPEWQDVPVVLHTFVPLRELTQTTTLQTELGVQRMLYKPATTLVDLCSAVQAVMPVTP
jgi:DNA-binding response OmpR family regulator